MESEYYSEGLAFLKDNIFLVVVGMFFVLIILIVIASCFSSSPPPKYPPRLEEEEMEETTKPRKMHKTAPTRMEAPKAQPVKDEVLKDEVFNRVNAGSPSKKNKKKKTAKPHDARLRTAVALGDVDERANKAEGLLKLTSEERADGWNIVGERAKKRAIVEIDEDY